MRFTPCCDWDFHSSVYKIQATDCDDAMTTGPQDRVSLTPELEIVGWGKPTPIHDQEANAPELDETDARNETPPEAPDNGTKNSVTSPIVLDLVDDEADTNAEVSGNADTNNSSVAEAQPGSSACTETPSKPQPEAEQMEIQRTPTVEKEDDDEVQIIDVRTLSALKRKPSATPVAAPEKKRSKHNNDTNSEQEEGAGQLANGTRAQTIESEGADTSEEESDSDGEEAEDSRDVQALATAKKAFTRVCKKCKVDANKALKSTYEAEISILKREHHNERRTSKVKAAQVLRDAKADAIEARKEMKAEHAEEIQNLKTTANKKLIKKISDLKAKHDSAIEDWKEKHADDRDKIKKLGNERDVAVAKRKEIEKSAAAQVRDARDEWDAGKRKLKEERRQMIREKQEEIDQLKPEYSKVVKNNEVMMKEATQHILKLEAELAKTQRVLHASQTESSANKQRHEHCKGELAQTQRQFSNVKKGLEDFNKYTSNVEKRASSDVARFKDKLELANRNLHEQSERVITQQRENYQLKDSVQALARLGREQRDENERLKAELKATKAELGLDLAEALDGVEES